jgi:ribosomal protein L20
VSDVSTVTLGELAVTINREHGLAYQSALDALQHAILCGQALIEARATVPDGEWLRWVDDNLDISAAAIHRFVRIATYRDHLLQADQRPKSINAAISYLRDVGAPAVGSGRKGLNGRRPTFDVDEAKRLRGQGMTFVDIGEALGVSDVAVWRQLTPGATRQAMSYTARARKKRRAERRALVEKERADAVARVGGSASDAYALLRRCAIALDRAIADSAAESEVSALRDALAFTHKAEDAIVVALRLERAAS